MSRRNPVLQSLLDSSSSSDDDELILTTAYLLQHEQERLNAPRYGGSVPGHQVLNRDRQGGHARLYQDYFSDAPTYGPTFFRRRYIIRLYVCCIYFMPIAYSSLSRRYRMSRSLFLRIANAVEEHDSFFKQRRDAAGRLGLSPLQKITAAFRMLTYGVPADATDEIIHIGESTVIQSLERLVKAIVQIFEEEYLISPNDFDTARLLAIGESKGFFGMLGSLDCMH